MKWFIAAALVIGVLALVFMAPGSKRTTTDVDAMMKRVRAAKARKARERKEAETKKSDAPTHLKVA